MTKPTQALTKHAAPADPNVLRVQSTPGQSDAAQLAAVALDGVAANAMTARNYSAGTFGILDVTECVTTLKQRANATQNGDLRHAEATLTAQAATLDAIFNEMARRAAINAGEYMEATERYMRLALKAQSQCRATLETLATIKNPPVVFARQANIAHGPQQVNNGPMPIGATDPTHGGNTATAQNELLEGPRHGSTLLDARTTPTPTRGHSTLETLEPIHRPEKRRRKSTGRP